VSRERTPGRVAAGRRNQKLALAAKKAKQLEERPPAMILTIIQERFLAAVLSGQYRDLGMGGGIRGTKTFALFQAIVILCRLFPRSRWAIVRKDLPTIKRNTLPSFEKFRGSCSNFVGEVNRSQWISTCSNGSEILFFPESLQQDPDYNRWRGLEVNGFGLEEANELAEATKNKAIERAGSWIIPPDADGTPADQPPPLRLYTFNPCDNWPRTFFYEPYVSSTLPDGRYFLPATIADNPYATEEYKESLKDLPDIEYNRFVLGDWSRITIPNQLISFEWITAAAEVEKVGGEAREAMDVGWMGDDPTVVARLSGNALVELQEWGQLRTDESAGIAAKRMIEHGIPADRYVVDAVGDGAGTYDNLIRAGFNVVAFPAGGKPIDRRVEEGRDKKGKRAAESIFRFANIRSQAWWEFREKLRMGMFRIGNPPGTPRSEWVAVTHPLLVQDLLAPRYEITGDKVISVESKKTIKVRIGRSTDYGDAVVMAAFDLPKVLPRVFTPAEYAGSYVKW
jgi:hypothetical protein